MASDKEERRGFERKSVQRRIRRDQAASEKIRGMKTYFVRISWMQPYPKEAEYRVPASHVSTAASRALKLWKDDIGRKRYDNLIVRIIPINN